MAHAQPAPDAPPSTKASTDAPKAAFEWFEYSGADPSDAAFKPGPGQYANPILKGTYPDPAVMRVGKDFYLVSSTFAWFPGLPVFHSTDLVHWNQIGNAIDRPGMLDFKRLGLSRAVFAPTLSHHDGLFYILNTCVDCGGNFLITAKDPKGPWSDPVWLPAVEGIDPYLFFDDNGRALIVFNGEPPGKPEYSGHRAIWAIAYDVKTQKTVGERKLLLDKGVNPAAKPIWPEGPHILKKDGWYYLVAAEGGTAEGHSQVVLRSKSAWGPYAPYADNPILTQRGLPADRPYPITSAGHATLVDTPDGKWWATFLAVRPYGDDLYNTGRETFLLPLEWKDGWPVILENGKTIPYVHAKPDLPATTPTPSPTTGAFTARDEFDGKTLPLNWVTMRIPQERWWRMESGKLILKARPETIGGKTQPSFWGRRQQHINASASTLMRFDPRAAGDKAGMVAVQNDDHFFFLGLSQDAAGRTRIVLDRRTGPNDPVEGVEVASAPFTLKAGAPVWLKITARGGLYDFSYALAPDQWTVLKAGEDGTILSTKKAGGFVGALLGVYAHQGQAQKAKDQ
ncbi:MAG: glycoside hydrolase family 43 protein [Caulobacter sp.]|nr:glycoside hydrolase family 43 protein [Caulobacter sp.]